MFLRHLGLSDFNLWEILLNYFVHHFSPFVFLEFVLFKSWPRDPSAPFRKKSFIPFLYTAFGCLVSTKILLGSGACGFSPLDLHWGWCVDCLDLPAGFSAEWPPWVPWSVPPLTVGPCTWSWCPRQCEDRPQYLWPWTWPALEPPPPSHRAGGREWSS